MSSKRMPEPITISELLEKPSETVTIKSFVHFIKEADIDLEVGKDKQGPHIVIRFYGHDLIACVRFNEDGEYLKTYTSTASGPDTLAYFQP